MFVVKHWIICQKCSREYEVGNPTNYADFICRDCQFEIKFEKIEKKLDKIIKILRKEARKNEL